MCSDDWDTWYKEIIFKKNNGQTVLPFQEIDCSEEYKNINAHSKNKKPIK